MLVVSESVKDEIGFERIKVKLSQFHIRVVVNVNQRSLRELKVIFRHVVIDVLGTLKDIVCK